MTRLRLRRVLFLVTLAAAVGAFVVALLFSFYQSRIRDVSALERGSVVWTDAVERMLQKAERLLEKTSGEIQGQPLTKVEQVLQQLAFDFPTYREAGYQVDGMLLCTSFGIMDPPTKVLDADAAIVPPPGKLHIVPPSTTLKGGRSLILSWQAGDSASLVNVLIAPGTITETLRYVTAHQEYVIYLVRGDGSILLESADSHKLALPPEALPLPGRSSDGLGMTLCRKVGGYDVYVVAIMPSGVVSRKWLRSLPVYALLGVLGAAMFLVAGRQLSARLGPVAELREAIRHGQIEAFYQPVIDLQTGQCCGAEALARWRHPERGLVIPALFIPAVEKAGLITEMTLALVEGIAKTLPPLLQGRPDLHININISSESLDSPTFLGDCLGLLAGKIDPSQICFEITESMNMGDSAVARMKEIKSHGIRLAVDDFGTGYSNLRYLKDFPFDILKIDKAFVDGINSAQTSSGLVDHIIKIGESCGLDLVAEGIEFVEQALYLKQAGVSYGQGYYFSSPLSLREFQVWLERRRIPSGQD